MPDSLALLASQWREDAQVLRRRGAEAQAVVLEACAAELTDAAGSRHSGAAAQTRGDKTPSGASHLPMENGGLITVAEAADVLGVSKRWVYEHRDELPVVRIGPRTLRFSRAELQRWLLKRQ